MAEGQCFHLHRITAVWNCDLARAGDERSLYSAQLELRICESCGQVEIWSKAHRDLCSWLQDGQRSSTHEHKKLD
jgi:hypothetical protein